MEYIAGWRDCSTKKVWCQGGNVYQNDSHDPNHINNKDHCNLGEKMVSEINWIKLKLIMMMVTSRMEYNKASIFPAI